MRPLAALLAIALATPLAAQLTPEQVIHLKSRYLPFQDQACVNEILRWLAGEYVFDPDCLTD